VEVTLLVVFAGLPGSGKSVLARGVADAIGATYLRIDTIESAIVSTLMPFRDNPVGYVVAGRVAADQLAAGRDVVADAVNGVAPARAGWVALAAETGAALRFVEVRCSDAGEHRRRVEAREPEMPATASPPGTRCCGAATSHGLRSCPAGSSLTTSATRQDTSRTLSPGYRRGGETPPAAAPDVTCARPAA
jgi:predicted kinase